MAGREPGGRLVQAGEPRSIRLEAVRAVAALAVIVEHCYGYAHNYDPAAIFGSFRDRLLAATGNGVDLFYALSGYLLFLPFARWCWADAEAPDLGRYGRNRALRILPLYYVVIVTYLVVEGATRSQWWAFLTFTQNFFRGSLLQIDAPTWSIVVEVEFYVVLPLVGWLLFRTTRGSALRGAAALAGLVGVTLALNLSVTGDSPPSWQYSPATNAFYFLPGMVLAYLTCLRPERVTSRLPRPLRRSDLWVATGVALWMIHAWLWSHNELLALGCFLVLAACVLPLDRGLATTVLQLRALGLVGMVSYSIYLWHAPIVEALARVVPAGFPGLLVASVAASLAVGAVSYAVVERPFLLLRRSWSSASPAPASSTTKTSSGVR